MKNLKLYLKVLMILSGLLILILLFPPYTIEKKDYKFFDFVFNSEKVAKKTDKTYSFSIDSRKLNIALEDTIDALNIIIIQDADTTFNWVQIKELPKRKIIPKEKYYDYWNVADRYNQKLEYRGNPKYYRKDVVNIEHYTITKITKPYYDTGYRKILVTQLIFEIIIALLLSVLISVVLIFRNSKKVLK